jgi:hypothetical protein
LAWIITFLMCVLGGVSEVDEEWAGSLAELLEVEGKPVVSVWGAG